MNFKNLVCFLCFNDLEEETIYIDLPGQGYDVCKECRKKVEDNYNYYRG